MRFYTTERIGPNRALTPEGYLLCSEVPLARTGTMIYGPADGLPITPKRGDERIIIQRRPEDVFSPIALASMQGKPFVDDHPDDDVTPQSWAKLAKGIILNPRQGTGDAADLVIGDILITDPEIIEVVRNDEKLEISLGYDADYEQTAPGEGLQKNLIINHAALVDSGRCGPRCKIGDTAEQKGKRVSKFHDLMMKAFKAKDAAEVEKLAEELGDQGDPSQNQHHVHVHLPGSSSAGAGTKTPPMMEDEDPMANANGGDNLAARMTALEAKLDAIIAKMAGGSSGGASNEDVASENMSGTGPDQDPTAETQEPNVNTGFEFETVPGTEDMAKKAKDSAYLADAYQVFISQAEIIAPGARVPTFDRAARPAVTYSMLCGSRKELLQKAYSDARLARTIDQCNGGRAPTFDRMTCDVMRVMLATVAAEAARLNNKTTDSSARDSFGTFLAEKGSGPGYGVKGAIKTPADLNRLAREMYSKAG